MENIPLKLTLSSAKDLKDVNFFSKMDPYAVVSLSGNTYRNQEVRIPVSRNGGTNPSWNFPMKFTINEPAARENSLFLEVKLRSVRRVFGDKDIGVVRVPIKELLDDPGDGETPKIVTCPIRRPSGKSKGSLTFSYMFAEMVAPASFSENEPLMGHPHPVVGSGTVPPYAAPHTPSAQYATAYGYPPLQYQGGYPQAYPPPPRPQYGTSYGYPPAYGGYAPPQPAYGNPPVKNSLGMQLGAGLLGKAVEGLVIGAMEPDATGNDGGFDGFNGYF